MCQISIGNSIGRLNTTQQDTQKIDACATVKTQQRLKEKLNLTWNATKTSTAERKLKKKGLRLELFKRD